MFEFKDLDFLTDGEIALKIAGKTPSIDEKGYLPAYKYRIILHNSNDSIVVVWFSILMNIKSLQSNHT